MWSVHAWPLFIMHILTQNPGVWSQGCVLDVLWVLMLHQHVALLLQTLPAMKSLKISTLPVVSVWPYAVWYESFKPRVVPVRVWNYAIWATKDFVSEGLSAVPWMTYQTLDAEIHMATGTAYIIAVMRGGQGHEPKVRHTSNLLSPELESIPLTFRCFLMQM